MPPHNLDRAVGALDGASGEDAGRLRIRVLITRSWTELEVNGLGPALGMLHDAREQAAAIDDRLLVALSHVQEGVIHVRGGDWAASLTALDGVGDDEAGPRPQPALRPADQPGDGAPRARAQRRGRGRPHPSGRDRRAPTGSRTRSSRPGTTWPAWPSSTETSRGPWC